MFCIISVNPKKFPRSKIHTLITLIKTWLRSVFSTSFYPYRKILNFCETFCLRENKAQNKKLLSQMTMDVLN